MRRLPALLCAALLSGCPAHVSTTTDAGSQSASDAGSTDAGPSDAGPVDAGAPDAGTADAGPTDAGAETDGGDCTPSAGQSFPDFPANPALPDAGRPFACDPDAGAVSDIDALIAQMAPGSWHELPCTQMANVCPQPYEHYGCSAVMGAWSGAAYDTTSERLLVFGGGHSDSYYNQVFAFDLASATWSRLSEFPAGLTGDHIEPAFRDKRLETCGLYPRTPDLCIPNAWLTASGYVDPSHCHDPALVPQLDPQQPRSVHSYGNLAFSSATGRFYILGSVALYPSGQSGTSRVSAFDPTTRQWSEAAGNPNPGYGTSATDAAGHIWYVGNNGGAQLLEFDPVANTWTAQSSLAMNGYYGAADVDTQRNVLVITADGLGLATYALGSAGAPLTQVTSTGLGAALPGAPGMAYSAPLDRFVAWNGGQTLYFLDPTSWHWTTVTGAGADPGPKAGNGTFGRFRYSPGHHVFIAVSDTQANVFIYKPPTSPP